MKRKIVATTIFLFILLNSGCRIGDPIIGKWKPIGEATQMEKLAETGSGYPTEREFLSDGTFINSGFKGTWRRLDDHRLEMQGDINARMGQSPSIVTVTIEDNVATFTSSDGTVTKWERQGSWNMDSTQLFNVFQSYLEQLPTFLALIAGIVFAITRWKHHPRVAMVVVIALVYLLFHMIVFTIVYNVVPRWVIRSSGSYQDFRTVIDRVYLVLGLITNSAGAIGFGLLLAAIFMRRPAEPVAET